VSVAAQPLAQTALRGLTPRRRGRVSGETFAAFLFLLPWLLGLAAFTIGPILVSLYLAFTEYTLLSPPRWIGLDNFMRMFTADPRFWGSVKATALYVALSVPTILVFSLGLALILNRGSRLIPAYRVLIYLPSLMGTSVAVAILWRQVFGPTASSTPFWDCSASPLPLGSARPRRRSTRWWRFRSGPSDRRW